MASRPFTRSKQKKESYSFEVRFWIFCAVFGLLLLGLVATILVLEHVSAAPMIATLVILALALLLALSTFVEQMVRPMQTLANVVAALREDDYSFRARGATRDNSLGELSLEINALADTLQTQKLSALEAVALFRRVLGEIDAPVLTFDQWSKLRLMNPAAERVFQLTSPRDLGRFARDIGLENLLDQQDEGIVNLEVLGQPTRWMIRRSTFRERGVPHTLLLLSDVSAALREEERIAWRRLIRVLGHEISNSLAPIKSIAGSLRSRLAASGGSALSPDLERGLGVIESRAEALNRFVQAYRQLAQLPAPVKKRVPLVLLLERVVGLETRLDVMLGDVPEVDLLADADQLEQLLINLVKNAVEAAISSHEEDEPVPLSAPAPQVTIQCSLELDNVAIFIEDNGPGLTNPANLFVPFYTTKKSGSGVGLVLARQIAEAHGGTLELRNRTDRSGCQAEVHIPLALQIAEPSAVMSSR